MTPNLGKPLNPIYIKVGIHTMNYEQLDNFQETMANLTADTIHAIVLAADANNKDRDSALENFVKVITEISANYSLDQYDPDVPVHHLASKN